MQLTGSAGDAFSSQRRALSGSAYPAYSFQTSASLRTRCRTGRARNQALCGLAFPYCHVGYDLVNVGDVVRVRGSPTGI